MTWQSVGVISPGEMGTAVATVLHTHGLRVVTCLQGRSARTQQRADAAQLEVVPTLERLVTMVDAVLSIVPTYAGFTKVTTALLLELTLMAHAWGCLDTVLDTYASTYPEAFRLFTTHLTTWPEYAAIRAQEMVELTATVEAAQLESVMAPGAAQIIAALAKLPWKPQASSD